MSSAIADAGGNLLIMLAAAVNGFRTSQAPYQNAANRALDKTRFEAGFKLGWHDAGDPNVLDKRRKMIERAEEYSNNHGADRRNVFEQGYSQGWDARKEELNS